jgi:hypothetical protein
VSRGFQALFVACILVASTAMFALAESRKLDRAPIKALVLSSGPAVAGHPRPAVFSPTCKCSSDYARIEFRLGKPGPLEAWIVSPAGAVVKRIADFRDVRRVALRWDGRTESGSVAPDSSYRLRLRVAGALRTLPVFVVVDTKPPRFHATLSRTKLVPLGYTVDDKTLVSWRSAEQLFHITVVARLGDRTQKVLVRQHSKSGSVDWPRSTCDAGGKCHRSKAAEGDWRLQLVASDQAGNAATVALGTVQVVTPR